MLTLRCFLPSLSLPLTTPTQCTPLTCSSPICQFITLLPCPLCTPFFNYDHHLPSPFSLPCTLCPYFIPWQ